MGAENMKKWLGFLIIGLVLLGIVGMMVFKTNQKSEEKLVTINNQAFLDVMDTNKSGIFYIFKINI